LGEERQTPDVDLEEEATWPTELLKVFDVPLPVLQGFEGVDLPKNIVRRATASLTGRSLVGFHCTNLHPDEVTDLLMNGLETLSPGLCTRRVRARVAAGQLSPALASRILNKSLAAVDYRVGLLFVIFSKSTLRHESAVYRLLDYWGGEALYASHENNRRTSESLKRIGRPSIVEVSIPVSDMSTYPPLGERFLTGFLNRRGVEIECEFEESFASPVPAGRIRRVLTPADDCFFELTGRSREAEPQKSRVSRKSRTGPKLCRAPE
jgi:hypothetical protein